MNRIIVILYIVVSLCPYDSSAEILGYQVSQTLSYNFGIVTGNGYNSLALDSNNHIVYVGLEGKTAALWRYNSVVYALDKTGDVCKYIFYFNGGDANMWHATTYPSLSDGQITDCPCPEGQERLAPGEQCIDKCPTTQIRNPSTHQCEICPSGQFTGIPSVCIPLCGYIDGRIPDTVNNYGTGLCIDPQCSGNEVEDETGHCIHNCTAPSLFDVTTGDCFIPQPTCAPCETLSGNSCIPPDECGSGTMRNPGGCDCVSDPCASGGQPFHSGPDGCEPDEALCSDGTPRDAAGDCPPGPCPGDVARNSDGKCPEQIKGDPLDNDPPVIPPEDQAADLPDQSPENGGTGKPSSTTDINNDGYADNANGHANTGLDGDNDGDKDDDGTNDNSGTTNMWDGAGGYRTDSITKTWGVTQRVVDYSPITIASAKFSDKTFIPGLRNILNLYKSIANIDRHAPTFVFEFWGDNTMEVSLTVIDGLIDAIRWFLSALIYIGLIFIVIKQWRMM